MKKIFIALLCVCVVFTAAEVYGSGEKVMVVSYSGMVKVIPSGSTEPVTCRPGMFLKAGARVITGDESYVMVAFDRNKNNVVKIKANSEVVLKLEGAEKIELIDGTMFTMLQGLKRGETFRVRTPDTVCGARGTGWKNDRTDSGTQVAVFDGSVVTRGINADGSIMEEDFVTAAGYSREVKRGSAPGKPVELTADEMKAMKKEFSLGSGTSDSTKMNIMRTGDKIEEVREKQMESIQESRDSKIEKQDKREERPSTGGFKTITKGE